MNYGVSGDLIFNKIILDNVGAEGADANFYNTYTVNDVGLLNRPVWDRYGIIILVVFGLLVLNPHLAVI